MYCCVWRRRQTRDIHLRWRRASSACRSANASQPAPPGCQSRKKNPGRNTREAAEIVTVVVLWLWIWSAVTSNWRLKTASPPLLNVARAASWIAFAAGVDGTAVTGC